MCTKTFKFHPRTYHEGPERDLGYGCTLSLTSALDGVGAQRHAPAALPPGKNWYPLYRRLGGPQSRSGHVRKFSLPPGFDPRTIQPLAHLLGVCYLKDIIQAHKKPKFYLDFGCTN